MVRRGTYSIVARDPATGELGAAVQSHWFAVGPIVPWVRAGVGAVCTQSVAEPAYGPRLLDRLEAGDGPQEALDALLAADPSQRFRQVAVIDADGNTATHTGEGCIAFAGHVVGDGFSAQANMMASPDVWPAMHDAFVAAVPGLSLAGRLLAALRGAEGAGGDVRGRQSAAMLVAPATGERWRRTVDLRVDDHDEPLDELERLLGLSAAYALATEGDDFTGEGRHAEAGECYTRAAALAPSSHELLFWAGLAAWGAGDRELALHRVRRAIDMQPGWADLLPRLADDISPAAPEVTHALGLNRDA
jgi:uncharacterized Ntn-hydrolase superfamily protein